MMDDIVVRLRLAGTTEKISMPGKWAHEAANELVRLREALKDIQAEASNADPWTETPKVPE